MKLPNLKTAKISIIGLGYVGLPLAMEFAKTTLKSIPNTNCIPVQIIAEKMKDLENYRSKTIIVYCRSGNRSETATKILNENGFKAFNMIGGINGWEGEVVHN